MNIRDLENALKMLQKAIGDYTQEKTQCLQTSEQTICKINENLKNQANDIRTKIELFCDKATRTVVAIHKFEEQMQNVTDFSELQQIIELKKKILDELNTNIPSLKIKPETEANVNNCISTILNSNILTDIQKEDNDQKQRIEELNNNNTKNTASITKLTENTSILAKKNEDLTKKNEDLSQKSKNLEEEKQRILDNIKVQNASIENLKTAIEKLKTALWLLIFGVPMAVFLIMLWFKYLSK